MAISEKMSYFAEKSSWIRKMFEEGAKMKSIHGKDNVFDFSLGNPDAPPPDAFTDVISRVVQDTRPGTHSYMPNSGYPWVREKIAARMSKEQETPISLTETVMTCGAAGGLNIILKALLNPGDEVIVFAPYFVEYGFYIDNHGGKTVVVPTSSDFTIDIEELEAALTEKTKALIINSPNNPSGQIYTKESLDQIGNVLTETAEKLKTTIYLISDEPYRTITFDNHTVPPIFPSYHNAIVASSFSKDLSLPGERIGYLAVHPEIEEKNNLLDALSLANRILGFVNAPALMQRVVAELQEERVDISHYAKRKDLFCNILDDAGFSYSPPKGAFYFFPKTPIDDVEFVQLLQQERILAVPGKGFGAPGHMRLAFCVADDVIKRSAKGFQRAYARAIEQT